MASAGSHKATTILDTKADGMVSGTKKAAKANKDLEDQVARLDKQLRKSTDQLKKQEARFKRLEAQIKKNKKARKGLWEETKKAGMQLQGWISTGREAFEVLDKLAERQLKFANVTANVPFSIDAARDATKGLISDYDLMNQAVTANRLGVAKTSKDFANLAGISTKLGVTIGKDATGSLENFVNGLGRGSTEVLDNIGITIRAEEAHKALAAQLGVSVASLTEQQKRQSVVNLGLLRGAEAADKATLALDGMGVSWAQAKVEAQNYLDTLLNVQENTAELAEETLKTLGTNQKEATTITKGLGDAVKVSALHVATFGISSSFYATNAAKAAIATDDLKTSIDRGLPSLTFLDAFLKQTGTSAERAAKGMRALEVGFQNVGKSAERDLALANREIRELEDSARFDAGRKLREKILKEAKDRRKKNAKDAREAAEAELQINVDQATRERQIFERRVKDGDGATTDLIALIDSQAAAERDLANLQFRHATTRTEQLRLVGTMEASEHDAATARLEARAEMEDRLIEQSERIATKQSAALEQRREIAMVEAEIEANRELREAERIEDPIDRLERETEVRLELIDVKERAANDTVTQLQLADQKEAALHDLKMARLDEEEAARKKTIKTLVGITQKSSELHLGAAQSVATSVLLEGKSLKESIKNTAAAEGGKQLIIGASELLRAAVAAASYNVPKAGLHLANAGASFAFAGAMAAAYGIAGGFSGGKKSAGSFGSSDFSGGTAAGSGGGPPSSSSGDSPDIPDSAGVGVGIGGGGPATAAGGGAAPAANGPTVIIQGDVIGVPKKEFMAGVDKGLRDLGYGSRRVS